MRVALARPRDDVTFSPDARQAARQRDNTLLKWLEEFQPKESNVACGILAEHPSGDGRSLARNHARRRRRRGRDREMDDLIGAQDMSGRNTGTRGTDVERLRKLDKLSSRGVRRAQENGHLQANARGSSRIRGIHALTILQKTSLHNISLSTRELVRE